MDLRGKRIGRGTLEWASGLLLLRLGHGKEMAALEQREAEVVRLLGQGGRRVVRRVQKTEPEAQVPSEVTRKPRGGLFP